MSRRGVALALTLRSFLVQGSWNPRTLLGEGVGWILDPFLRECHPLDPERLEEASRRLREPFNAHPYLTGFALGALLKMEEEKTDPDLARRFRDVLRSPLGSLGDQLFWGALRPAALLVAIVLGVVGAPPLVAVLVFLIVYNVPHILVRFWGVRVGLELGRGVGEGLRRARLPRAAERIRQAGVLVVGLLVGSLFAGLLASVPGPAGALLALLPLVLVAWGVVRGDVVQRLAPWLLVGTVALVLGFGSSFPTLP